MSAVRDSLDSSPARNRDPRLEIAPMLDITFLLLIFFLCVLDFKVLEGRLDAFLPRDGAADRSIPTDTREEIEIRLEARGEEGSSTVVFVSRRPVGVLEGRDASEAVVLDRLEGALGRLRHDLPEASCRIDAAPGVPHGHVVGVVDAAMRRGYESVGFARRSSHPAGDVRGR